MSGCIASEAVASKSDSSAQVMYSQTVETTVKAVSNPAANMKVYATLNVTWDGSDCYVVGRDGKYFDRPILAQYSRTYPGYPYRVNIGNQTWYFSL